MLLLFIMTRLSSAETLTFTLVISHRPTNVSITIIVLQSHKLVCDFKLVLCSYFYLFSFLRLNVSTSHFHVSHLFIDSPSAWSAQSIAAQQSHFVSCMWIQDPHIFKHQIEGKNLVLHLCKYGTENNRNRPSYTQFECTIKEWVESTSIYSRKIMYNIIF
jgi:hypothetical protein